MNSLFASTRNERVALAKKRYFSDGIHPSGVVSETVFQSWTRCDRSKQSPRQNIEFQPVSAGRKRFILHKNRVLYQAWLDELTALKTVIRSTKCSAILTDANGILLGATPPTGADQRIISIAHRVGVNLAEESVGTTAPGIVARTRHQITVSGSEHYFEAVASMYCTAAPIYNSNGQLAGILDFSSEGIPFQFDPTGLVAMYAASIENRLLLAQSPNLLVIKFQFVSTLIDSPMVAMLGFNLEGRLVWLNSVANSFLSIARPSKEQADLFVEDIFESTFSQIASIVGRGTERQRLRSGLIVFLSAELNDSVPDNETEANHTAISMPSVTALSPRQATLNAALPLLASNEVTSLEEADAELIKKLLASHNGNISSVAKRLKVSRGLIYRRLAVLGIEAAEFKR